LDNPGNILISVEARHATNILNGEKTVELRRKPLKILAGTRVWIYSKVPCGQVRAIAVVKKIVSKSPIAIWKSYGKRSAITKHEFDAYFANAETGHAIIFQDVQPLAPELDLSAIRNEIADFHPPQFFKRLTNGMPELALFEAALVA
jgi:predicted transcriptional regulator